MTLKKALTSLALIALTSACASSGYNQADGPAHEEGETAAIAKMYQDGRTPAAISDEDFARIIEGRDNAVRIATTLGTRLLSLNLRAEGLIYLWEKKIDAVLLIQKKNPEYFVEPTSNPIYETIMTQRWRVDELHEEIIDLYERLHEFANRTDLRSEAELKARARALAFVNTLKSYIAKLPESRRVQLAPLMEMIEEVEKSHTAAHGTPNKDRMPAADLAVTNEFAKAVQQFNGKGVEKAYNKHRAEIVEEAMVEVAQAYPDYKTWPEFTPVSDRAPSAAEELRPSAGENGNVIGRVFPRGTFILTYDDGPKPAPTERLLGILKKHEAPASFFMLAQSAANFKSTVAKVKAAGFPMNSHSWSHANLTSSSTNLDKEINQSTDKLNEIFAYEKPFRFFRCPYGACYAPKSPRVRQMIADRGMIHAYWAVDSSDWKFTKQPSKTFELTSKQMLASGRGVVLFHDIHEGSVDASELLLNWITKQRAAGNPIKLKTIEDAVDDYNKSIR